MGQPYFQSKVNIFLINVGLSLKKIKIIKMRYTVQNLTFYCNTFPAEKVTSHKGDLFCWKDLVKVTFKLVFLNLPIPKTF